MTYSKKLTLLLLASISMLLLSSLVESVGVTGKTFSRETFIPNLEYNFSFGLLADADFDNNYYAYAKRDLAKYVVFEETKFENIPRGGSATINGKILFPSNLTPPGWHYASICVKEDCKEGGVLCARAGACASLEFLVLYPGIYPVISLSANDVKENEPVKVKAYIKNLGVEDIKTAAGLAEIYDLEKEKQGRANFNTKSVKSNGEEIIEADFNTYGLLPGDYGVTATIDCDGIIQVVNSTFRIGTLNIKIKNFTRELEAGGIKRFLITLESVWNDPLNVFADISIYNETSSGVEAKTATIEIPPWQTIDLEAFIDTAQLAAGDYNININVHYADRVSSVEDKIRLTSPPEAPATESPSGVSLATIITILLVVLLLLLTAVNIFLIIRKRKKKS
jgi:hypothetical protein